ncbi:MAG: anthrone oxygenase family protein [Pseudomonadota bacterium]
MSTLLTTVTVAAIVGSALIGGIFFAFSNFIMKALERVPPSQGMLVMQTINVTVLNRGFLGVFMGTALICLVLAISTIVDWRAAYSPYLLGGAVAYVGGTFFVTGLGNVPLNNKLASVNPDDQESARTWEHYLEHWTRLNTQRTGAALLAAVLFSIALVHV